ncbi:MAG TPA: rhodanese-like domain-containing protein [Verrucomicrobiae bacterium]|jgi:rhodanese-related sulfurtransferase
MQTTTMPDPQKARAYFENKVAFTMGPVELVHMLEAGNVNVVDVREPEDYEEGHIPGAVNLPRGTWESPKGLAKDKVNVVYCYSQQCHLAANACVAFAEKGFPVMELEGGFDVWEKHELQIETGAGSDGQVRKAA